MADVVADDAAVQRWLVRPGKPQVSRILILGALSLLLLAVTAGAASDNTAWIFAAPFFALMAGLCYSGIRRVGAFERKGVLEMHTIVSCTRIPVTDVEALHVTDLERRLGVQTKGRAYVIGSRAASEQPAADSMLADCRAWGEKRGVRVVEYTDPSAFNSAMKGARMAGRSVTGFLSLFRRPDVLGAIVVGVALVIVNVV